MLNKINIAAVVVTYNRLELLKECIEALRNQTRKLDEIIVVNNDSKDGTKVWLDAQEDLTKIHQDNLGGAGGFHNGMKLAYEKGFDWIWLMDDDCLPELNALENLFTTEYDSDIVLNSTVLSKKDKNQLSFGLEDDHINHYYITISEISGRKFVNGANFFNGTLISRKTIEAIGFPQPLFFIYGDELEYYLRIKKAGIIIKTVFDSIVLHPLQKHKYIGRGKLFYKLIYFNRLNAEFVARNLMAIWFFYEEFTFRRLIKTYFYDLGGILVLQKKLDYFFIYLKSIFEGYFFIQKLKKNQK